MTVIVTVAIAVIGTFGPAKCNCLEADLKSSKSHKDISYFYLQALGRMCRVCPVHLPHAGSDMT